MTKTKMIGWTAMAVCALGYATFGGVVLAAKFGTLETPTAVLLGAVAALIGEAGLWVGAGCLGLTIFKKRKALLDRIFRRRVVDTQRLSTGA